MRYLILLTLAAAPALAHTGVEPTHFDFAPVVLADAPSSDLITGTAAPAADPTWLKILLALLPLLIAGAVSMHPLLMLADFLKARAADHASNNLVRGTFLAGESLARSLDHWLEVNQKDVGDLSDPKLRAEALQHLRTAGVSGALPAVADAAKVLGEQWLSGAATKTVDTALDALPNSAKPTPS